MRIFYTDTPELFECLLQVDGAPLTDATARIIIACDGKEFIFDCDIDINGNCTVTIPELVDYDILGLGTIQLEVTVEDVVFYPYQDSIEIRVPTDSGFNEFIEDANFDGVNLLTSPTWKNRKVYSDEPYLVLPGLKFNIALGDTKPDLKFFVFKRGEQFGDPIPLPNIVNYSIVMKIYDYNNTLVAFGPVTVYDQSSGQFTYTFNALDFIKSGIYFFEVEFTSDTNTFTLPKTNMKNEIIVRE